jgi:caa(3)-type oxidase subunit IV
MTDPRSENAAARHAPTAAGYAAVWLVLVALATVALFASRAVTGGWGLVVTVAIAAAQAVLVIGCFMQLARGRSLSRLAVAVAIGFLALLALGILADLGTRSAASSYLDDADHPR